MKDRTSRNTDHFSRRLGGIYLDPEPTLTLYERQIAPLVAKAMAGFNSTIFAYGQTGSGKFAGV